MDSAFAVGLVRRDAGHPVAALALEHVVITSVNRDELPDGGAAIFAETIRQCRLQRPGMTIARGRPRSNSLGYDLNRDFIVAENLARLIDREFAVIGERMRRADGLGKVTGHAIYADRRRQRRRDRRVRPRSGSLVGRPSWRFGTVGG